MTSLFIFENIDAMYTMGVVLAGTALYVITKVVRTNNQKRQETQEQFYKVVTQLSENNETSQLSAAIILRRFFSADIDKKRFRMETINVISSMLKIHPTGIYQKTLGDGLAYAGNLNYADLQRTNLQDLYLGKKNEKDDEYEKRGLSPKSNQDDSWKITMDFTDMFGANLSYALVENVNGYGTVFNSAILNHTNIKNCSFKKADFKYADLTNVYFENVCLKEANFKGARGIPEEMLEHLELINKGTKEEALIYNSEAPFTMDKTKQRSSEQKTVFFSMPGTLTASEEALVLYYKELLEKKNIIVKYYTRDHYPKAGQITKVRQAVLLSDAMIAFGFKQIEIKKGCTYPNSDQEENFDNKWLPTPWNEIEVGMGAMANIPILLVRDDKVEIGVFDKIINEFKMKTMSTAIPLAQINNNEEFMKWLDLFVGIKTDKEFKEKMNN